MKNELEAGALKPPATEKTRVELRFGRAVRYRRKRLGLTQEALARQAGLHRTYVCDGERGKRNVSLQCIEKLALALETPIGSLFPESGDQPVPVKRQPDLGFSQAAASSGDLGRLKSAID
jgi:transcriptional regulator with XRE-family HTH domain